MGFAAGGPFGLQKSTVSGPETKLSNLKYPEALGSASVVGELPTPWDLSKQFVPPIKWTSGAFLTSPGGSESRSG